MQQRKFFDTRKPVRVLSSASQRRKKLRLTFAAISLALTATAVVRA